jgi:ABC-type transporter Mla subunit MlaD
VRPRGASPFAVGAVLLVVALLGTYLAFTKDVPLTRDQELHAVVASATSIRPGAPVRIAGVEVGEVTGVAREPGTTAARLTMQIRREGLPVHRDASLKIRPRIFLEGNFFVDLRPGTPRSPVTADGDTLPLTRTAVPVQLDEVLTALQSDTREDLRGLLDGYGTGLHHRPTAAQDTGQDPAVRGESAAQALNDATADAPGALRSSAMVTDALRGAAPRDVSRLLAGLDRTARGLGADTPALQRLIWRLDATTAAFADRRGDLRRTLARLPGTLSSADRALARVDAALPATRAFARTLVPGLREMPATIAAFSPWSVQARALLGRGELRGLARELRPATGDLARTLDASTALLPQAELVARCLTDVVIPTGNVTIRDGALSTGVENYKELFHGLVGLAGESQNFDANGQYVRFQPGGGAFGISTGPILGSAGGANDRLFGNAAARPLGTRPAFPGTRPPYRPDARCHEQALPRLNDARTGPADGSGR